jgi:hypothetical protein
VTRNNPRLEQSNLQLKKVKKKNQNNEHHGEQLNPEINHAVASERAACAAARESRFARRFLRRMQALDIRQQ